VFFKKKCPVNIPEEFLEQFCRIQTHIKIISLIFYSMELFVKLFEKKMRKLVAALQDKSDFGMCLKSHVDRISLFFTSHEHLYIETDIFTGPAAVGK